MATLRKTLPKDLDALLAGGDFAAITAALAKCLPDAQDSFGRTALAYAGCTEALTEWLLARGASLTARDRWGNTLLQNRVTVRGDVDALLRRGVAVDEVGGNGGTALHTAATTNKVAIVDQLLRAGAPPNATDRQGRTPLEAALMEAHNAMLPSLLTISRALLAAGATRTPTMAASVTRIGERFEFMRASFNKELLPAADEALAGLYTLFEVPPVGGRRLHDGSAPIVATASGWQKQFKELWDLLVPGSGPATTAQGEVIRIAGRIGDEVLRNGGANWDARYRDLAATYLAILASGTPLPAEDLTDARNYLRGCPRDAAIDPLTRMAVAWVAANPTPVPR